MSEYWEKEIARKECRKDKIINRFVTYSDPSILEMADTILKLESLRKSEKIDFLAFEPHPNFEEYIRENMEDINSMELHKTGHDIMVLSYANVKNIPIY